VVNPLAFELCLNCFTIFGDRPHVLRPTVTLLRAVRPSPETRSQKRKCFHTIVYPDFVTQRLTCARRARWRQSEVAWVALVLRIARVPYVGHSREQSLLPSLKLVSRTKPAFGIVSPSSQH
jgi:hypothetical protein